MGERRWQQWTDDEKAAWVAATNRAACAAHGVPEFVTDPAHLEPAVRAVLAVAAPFPSASAGRGRGTGASSRAHATPDGVLGEVRAADVGPSGNSERSGLTADAASARRSMNKQKPADRAAGFQDNAAS